MRQETLRHSPDGPASVEVLANATGMTKQQVRYALVLLRDSNRISVTGKDGQGSDLAGTLSPSGYFR